MRKWHLFVFPSLFLFAILLGRLIYPEPFDEIQLKSFDIYQHLKPRPYQEAPVRIVDIDDESLERLGQWPWPRTRVAKLVESLEALEAGPIVFDIVFAEPDRTSPANVLQIWKETSPTEVDENQFAALPDHDHVLGGVIGETIVVKGFALTNEANDKVPPRKAKFAYVGDGPQRFLPPFRGAVVNLPVISAGAKGVGSINTVQEMDGIIRRVPLLFRLNNKLYPSLMLEALRCYQGKKNYLIRYTGDASKMGWMEADGISSVRTGKLTLETDPIGRVWLYDSGYKPQRFIAAWRVLEGQIDASEVKGKIMFIGTSAAGLKDLRTTPLNPSAAGIEVHAQLAEQAFNGQFLTRPYWTGFAEGLYAFVAGLILILLLPMMGPFMGALMALILIAGAVATGWYSFANQRLLLDPSFPGGAILLLYIFNSLLHHMQTENERKRVRTAFSHYMSPVMVARLAKHPNQLKLGGEMKDLTLLFSDIRGFTAISEQFNAQELTQFMNRFLTPMTEIIMSEQGTIDKYVGDCIMSFWNAPIDQANHAALACTAAVRMKDYLVQWNLAQKARAAQEGHKFIPVEIGIGLNTGECCVGNIGSEQRFDYSVLGDEVNLASRLEGQCKTYGVDIIIGEQTYREAPDFAAIEMDIVQVKGRNKPERIFNLRGGKEMKESAQFRDLNTHHQKMLIAYRAQNWEAALKMIEECRELDYPQTRLRALYNVYDKRIHSFIKNPPGEEWSGITIAITK